MPNYDAGSVAATVKVLSDAGLPPRLMIDCSHANSSKQPDKQLGVAEDIARQIATGSRHIFGIMVESHLVAGAQKYVAGKDDPRQLQFGKSITDGCLGWDDSLRLLQMMSQTVADTREDRSEDLGSEAALCAETAT